VKRISALKCCRVGARSEPGESVNASGLMASDVPSTGPTVNAAWGCEATDLLVALVREECGVGKLYGAKITGVVEEHVRCGC